MSTKNSKNLKVITAPPRDIPEGQQVRPTEVSGGFLVAVEGHARETSCAISFPIVLTVGEESVCLTGEGAKDLIRLLLKSL